MNSTSEKPLIMSGASVIATLEDRKHQTRRVIKPQPAMCNYQPSNWQASRCDWVGYKYSGRDTWFCHTCGAGLRAIDEWSSHGILCPYGQVGSHIWVRETWHQDTGLSSDKTIHYKADNLSDSYSWKPSIFMPRWASRLTLEITGVRVERVQEISHEDAIAEGCLNQVLSNMEPDFDMAIRPASDVFHELWDSLNKKRGYGWAVNPWTWALDYKRVEGLRE